MKQQTKVLTTTPLKISFILIILYLCGVVVSASVPSTNFFINLITLKTPGTAQPITDRKTLNGGGQQDSPKLGQMNPMNGQREIQDPLGMNVQQEGGFNGQINPINGQMDAIKGQRLSVVDKNREEFKVDCEFL
jgi:hypothetical protein